MRSDPDHRMAAGAANLLHPDLANVYPSSFLDGDYSNPNRNVASHFLRSLRSFSQASLRELTCLAGVGADIAEVLGQLYLFNSGGDKRVDERIKKFKTIKKQGSQTVADHSTTLDPVQARLFDEATSLYMGQDLKPLFVFMITLIVAWSGTVEKPADGMLMLIWIVCMLNKEISAGDPDGKHFILMLDFVLVGKSKSGQMMGLFQQGNDLWGNVISDFQTSYRSYYTVQLSDLCKRWLEKDNLSESDRKCYFDLREGIKDLKEFDRLTGKWKRVDNEDRLKLSKANVLVQWLMGRMGAPNAPVSCIKYMGSVDGPYDDVCHSNALIHTVRDNLKNGPWELEWAGNPNRSSTARASSRGGSSSASSSSPQSVPATQASAGFSPYVMCVNTGLQELSCTAGTKLHLGWFGEGIESNSESHIDEPVYKALKAQVAAAPKVSKLWVFPPEDFDIKMGKALVPPHLWRNPPRLIRERMEKPAAAVAAVVGDAEVVEVVQKTSAEVLEELRHMLA